MMPYHTKNGHKNERQIDSKQRNIDGENYNNYNYNIEEELWEGKSGLLIIQNKCKNWKKDK